MKPGLALGLSLLAMLAVLLLYWQPLAKRPPRGTGAEDSGEEAPATVAIDQRPQPLGTPAQGAMPDSTRKSTELPAQGTQPGVAPHGEVDDLPAPPAEPTGPVEQLKTAYERDPVDAKAGEAEAKIRALSGTEHVPAGTLLGVRCTRRVCRVQVRWSEATPLAYMAVAMLLHAENGEARDVAIDPQGASETGDIDLDIYVSREGYTLADFEDPAGKP